MSAVAGPLERLLSNPDTRVDDVLDLVDSLIEGADVDRDGTLLTGLRQRLEEIASERGGEWTRLLVAAARLRSLLEARGVVVGDATPAAVAVGVEAPPAPAPVSAPDVEAEAGAERVLDERPVNRRVRFGIAASVVVVGVAAATYYAIPRDSSAPTTARPPPAPRTTSPEPVAGTLCRQPGIHYAGTTAQGAEVCFTLTPDGSELVETAFSFVAASGCPDGAEGSLHSGLYPGTVDPSGRFEIPGGLTGRIHGVRASGVLEDSLICPGKKFEWSARRAP